MEERAVLLAELDQNEGGGAAKERQSLCRSCGRHCYLLCCDIGSISIMVTVALILLGVVLLVIVRVQDLPIQVDKLARYIISAGVFGLATGGTNAIALLMLLYKIPLVCGSGSVPPINQCTYTELYLFIFHVYFIAVCFIGGINRLRM